MPEPWQLLGERPGSSGRWLRATTASYRLPAGQTVEWDLLREPDAVAVLALTEPRPGESSEVVLARQFRPGPGAVLDELPGGLLDPGEDATAAAARELLEETGYAGQLEVLGWSWHDGRSTRRMWTAVATGCREVSRPRPGATEATEDIEGTEDIEVVLVSVAAFVAQVRAGALTDAARAYRALDHLRLLG